MGWLSSENEDSDGTSAGDRLGTLVHLLTAGGVLLGVVGFDRIGSELRRLETLSATVAIGSGVGITLLAVATVALCMALALGVVAWYRLPDPPT